MSIPKMLRGVAKHSGDGWKDTTRKGEVLYVWDTELPKPYVPGHFPRVGNPSFSAGKDMFDFSPVPVEKTKETIDTVVANERQLRYAAERERDTLNSKLRNLQREFDALKESRSL